MWGSDGVSQSLDGFKANFEMKVLLYDFNGKEIFDGDVYLFFPR